jgi:20S proteasome subunit alpha 3
MEDASAESKKEPKRTGVVIAAEKKVTSKLLDKNAGGGKEKIFTLNE